MTITVSIMAFVIIKDEPKIKFWMLENKSQSRIENEISSILAEYYVLHLSVLRRNIS